jgi:hypothetical protein
VEVSNVPKELRAAARRQFEFRAGMIEFGNYKKTSVPCTIRDLSVSGAGLELVGSFRAPDQFTLILSDGLRKSCQVAWRRGKRIGVCFTDGIARADEQAALMTEEDLASKRQIGARLRAAREARGYSQAELAKVIQEPCDLVTAAEAGEQVIPYYRMMLISDLLQIPNDWLVAGKGRTPAGVRMAGASEGASAPSAA